MSNFLNTSTRPNQQEIWTAFVAREAPTNDDSYAAACEAAAKLIIGEGFGDICQEQRRAKCKNLFAFPQ